MLPPRISMTNHAINDSITTVAVTRLPEPGTSANSGHNRQCREGDRRRR